MSTSTPLRFIQTYGADVWSVPSISSSLSLRMAARMSFLSSYSVLLRNYKRWRKKTDKSIALKKNRTNYFDAVRVEWLSLALFHVGSWRSKYDGLQHNAISSCQYKLLKPMQIFFPPATKDWQLSQGSSMFQLMKASYNSLDNCSQTTKYGMSQRWKTFSPRTSKSRS